MTGAIAMTTTPQTHRNRRSSRCLCAPGDDEMSALSHKREMLPSATLWKRADIARLSSLRHRTKPTNSPRAASKNASEKSGSELMSVYFGCETECIGCFSFILNNISPRARTTGQAAPGGELSALSRKHEIRRSFDRRVKCLRVAQA